MQTDNQQSRPFDAESILDRIHYQDTEWVRSISTDKFPAAYRETALKAMREYAIAFGEEVKKKCAEAMSFDLDDDCVKSIDVTKLIT